MGGQEGPNFLLEKGQVFLGPGIGGLWLLVLFRPAGGNGQEEGQQDQPGLGGKESHQGFLSGVIRSWSPVSVRRRKVFSGTSGPGPTRNGSLPSRSRLPHGNVQRLGAR